MSTATSHQYKHPHPAVAVDLCIFTLGEGSRLELLLVERGVEPFKGHWALPGGFVRMEEDLAEAAQRELEEETGLSQAYIEQVATFGKPDRDPRERVISVAYYAIVRGLTSAVRPGSDAAKTRWCPVDELPPLAFDHKEIIAAARVKLIDKVRRTSIALQFLPGEFTLSELQALYENIGGEPIDKRNFRKWAAESSLIKDTGRQRRGMQHRPAKLFRSASRGVMQVSGVAGALPESAEVVERKENAALDLSYRRGYQDALNALQAEVSTAQRSLLKDLKRG